MKKIQDKINRYVKERKWHKSLPSDIAKSIIIESAELLELFQWDNFDQNKIKKDKEKMAEIKKELADVFIYCFDMANALSIDSERVVLDKLDYVEKKYPANFVKQNRKMYLKIKKEYRKKGI